jgi:hypothetical protein
MVRVSAGDWVSFMPSSPTVAGALWLALVADATSKTLYPAHEAEVHLQTILGSRLGRRESLNPATLYEHVMKLVKFSFKTLGTAIVITAAIEKCRQTAGFQSHSATRA